MRHDGKTRGKQGRKNDDDEDENEDAEARRGGGQAVRVSQCYNYNCISVVCFFKRLRCDSARDDVGLHVVNED